MGRSALHTHRTLSLAALAALFVVALVLVPLALRTSHAEPSTGPLPTMTQDPAEPLTVFVGSASAAGAGASKPTERWSTLVSRTLGWQEKNQARAAAGFATSTLDVVVATKPKIVVVASDDTSFDPSDPKDAAAVLAYFRTLRQMLPEAKIIAIGPWSADAKPSAGAAALDKTVSSATRSVRGVYVSLLSPATIDRDMTTKNGVVLNDVGHQAVADRVIETLDDGGS